MQLVPPAVSTEYMRVIYDNKDILHIITITTEAPIGNMADLTATNDLPLASFNAVYSSGCGVTHR